MEHIQNLKISFDITENSFKIIPWPIIKNALNSISTGWEFISFVNEHKSAIIKINDSASWEGLLSLNSVRHGTELIHINITHFLKSNIKGIIYNKFLIPIEKEDLKESLKNQRVIDIIKIKKTGDDGLSYCTGSVILEFNLQEIPDKFIVDMIVVPVTRLSSRPMQCLHCMVIGHTHHKCKKLNVKLCKTCFHLHSEANFCTNSCKNCKKNHYYQMIKIVTFSVKKLKFLK